MRGWAWKHTPMPLATTTTSNCRRSRAFTARGITPARRTNNRFAEQADFAAEHLKPFGFSVIQIDDKWQDGVSRDGPRRIFTRHRPDGPYPCRHESHGRLHQIARPDARPVVHAVRRHIVRSVLRRHAAAFRHERRQAVRSALGRHVSGPHEPRGTRARAHCARRRSATTGAIATSRSMACGPAWRRQSRMSTKATRRTTWARRRSRIPT